MAALVLEGLTRFFEIFKRHKQHPKALAIFLAQMLVVDFVCLSNGHQVHVLCPFEQGEALVNEDVVHHEVGESVKCNACANPKAGVVMKASSDEAIGTWHCENQEEGVVLFEKAWRSRVMVFMKVPHGPMHQVLV